MHQAIITATITDATPAIITALLHDTRTDHDTHNAARKNPAKSAITHSFLRNTVMRHLRPRSAAAPTWGRRG
jgi:hypothetical protein